MENLKKSCKNNNLTRSPRMQHEKSYESPYLILNYFSDHILYQLVSIILNISQNINKEIIDNRLMKIFLSKRANRIIFIIKKGHCHEVITPETIKILQSNKNKTNKDKKGDNTPNLELTEVLSVFYWIFTNHY